MLESQNMSKFFARKGRSQALHHGRGIKKKKELSYPWWKGAETHHLAGRIAGIVWNKLAVVRDLQDSWPSDNI